MGSSLIGQLRILLGLETAQFETGAKKVTHDLHQMKEAAEVVKGALEALGIALSIDAVVEATRSALEYAASLEDLAKQTGLTVEQVQVLKRGAKESGIEWDKLKSGIEKFRITLGEAKAGLPAAAAAFKNIGIGKDQLQSFHDTDTALVPVMEGLKNVGDAATQAAAGKRLFGKAVGDLLPLLVEGKAGYDAMYESAVKSGLITAEEAARAHEAQVAIDDLALALKTRLAIAIADNTDGIIELTNKLGDLIQMAMNAINWMGKAKSKVAEFELAGNSALTRAGVGAGMIPASVGQAHIKANDEESRWIKDEQTTQDLLAKMGRYHVDGAGGGAPPPNRLDLKPTPHHRRVADHTEQREKEAEKLKYELAKEEIDAGKQRLEAQRELTIDTEDRLTISNQILQSEHDQKALEIDHNLKMVELDRTISAGKKAEAEKSAARQHALNDELLLLHKQGEALQAELAREGEHEKTTAAEFDAIRSKLEAEEKLAETVGERRKVELELLDLSYQEKRAALQRVIDTQYYGQYTHTYDERNRAQIDLNALNGRYASDKTAVLRGTEGPLEALRKSIPDTAAKMDEALQGIAANGLTQLNDGLAEASASWIKMGGVAGDVLRQTYVALMKLVLGRGLNSLLGALGSFAGRFGGGTPGQTVTLTSGAPALSLPAIPHLAGGGSMVLGGMAGIDRNLLSLNGSPLAMVGHGERLDISPKNDRAGGRPIMFDLRGAVMTQDLLMQMQSMANGAAQAGAVGGAAMAGRSLRRSGRRQLR